ncbi:hypothetical protein SVIOM342S_06155 [Streptomyces violaceorubidus]
MLLHRSTLIERLAALLPPDAVRTAADAMVAAETPSGHGPRPGRRAGGRPGRRGRRHPLHVRRALFPDHPGPVYSGFTTWRIVSRAAGAVQFAVAHVGVGPGVRGISYTRSGAGVGAEQEPIRAPFAS